MNASRSVTRETFNFSDRGITVLDSIYRVVNQKGKIVSPGSYGFALMYEKIDNWMVGAEFNYTGWSNYRFFGEPDAVKNNWTMRLGGQFIPKINSKSYWSRVSYRAGYKFWS